MGASSWVFCDLVERLAPMGRSYMGNAQKGPAARRPGLARKSASQAVCRLRGTMIWCSLGNSNPYFSLERATS